MDLDFLFLFQKSTTHGVTQRTTGSCSFLDNMNTGNYISASHSFFFWEASHFSDLKWKFSQHQAVHSIEYPHQVKSNQLTSHHFPKHLWCFHHTVHNRIFTARFIATDWNLWQWSSDCMAITLQILSTNAPYHRKHFTDAVLEKLRWYQIMFPTDSCTCCLAQNNSEPGKQQLIFLITVNPADLWFYLQNFCSRDPGGKAKYWGVSLGVPAGMLLPECLGSVCSWYKGYHNTLMFVKPFEQAISISAVMLLHSLLEKSKSNHSSEQQ